MQHLVLLGKRHVHAFRRVRAVLVVVAVLTVLGEFALSLAGTSRAAVAADKPRATVAAHPPTAAVAVDMMTAVGDTDNDPGCESGLIEGDSKTAWGECRGGSPRWWHLTAQCLAQGARTQYHYGLGRVTVHCATNITMHYAKWGYLVDSPR